MSMKSILVPVEGGDALRSMLETALLVARRFGCYIEGLHVRPALVEVVSADALGGTATLVRSFEREDAARTERDREFFDAFMRDNGVPRGESAQPTDEPSAGWREEVSPGDDVVASRGRVFDLIVVGRPVRGAAAPGMSTLEAALFESGHPILLAPPTPPTLLGETVAIAWNGSTETARAVTLALPFLTQAASVVVMGFEHWAVPGPSAAEVTTALLRHGVPARAVNVPADKRASGEAILQQTASLGADLLIKGAYTQSRLRQMIFGGATSYILANAEVSVLMAH